MKQERGAAAGGAIGLIVLMGVIPTVAIWPLGAEGQRGPGAASPRRTSPHLRGWHERYAGEGLTIVGVHSRRQRR
jgi:hypothetical protein